LDEIKQFDAIIKLLTLSIEVLGKIIIVIIVIAK